MKESNQNIQSEIIKTASGLSKKNLNAVLLYAKKLKSSKPKAKRNSGAGKINNDLKRLSDTQIAHLEQEFKDYKKIYPREE